ncbi:unnamed protein product [Rotaria sp. Silwood2]|nr:unnamed protein product [Rotaria sp. Silwood2]
MTIHVPNIERKKNEKLIIEYYDEHINDRPMLSILKMSYRYFVLQHGTISVLLQNNDIEVVKNILKEYFDKFIEYHLQRMIIDITVDSSFFGVQFLPVEKLIYIKVQSILRRFELRFTSLKETLFLHRNQLVCETNNEAFLCSSSNHIGEQKSKKTISPNLNREQTNESLPKYQSVVLNDGARIRIVNCSNDNTKHSSSRNSTNSTTLKRCSISIDKIDENCTTKSTRINTRKISSTNSKIPDTLEIVPSYQAQSVILSHNEISNKWLTHSVFYRCHVCSHEEFFVVLSRECIRLHISSKHGNMEENFKQRISNFLNNQGRALKIFQHYLKWQQPWSEKEIDQIFQLSNVNNRTNGIF